MVLAQMPAFDSDLAWPSPEYSVIVIVAPQVMNSNSLGSLNVAKRASVSKLDCAGVTTETEYALFESFYQKVNINVVKYVPLGRRS